MVPINIAILLVTCLSFKISISYDLHLPQVNVGYDFLNALKTQTAINSEINEYREKLNNKFKAAEPDLRMVGLTIPKYEYSENIPPNFNDLAVIESNISPKYNSSQDNNGNVTQMETTTVCTVTTVNTPKNTNKEGSEVEADNELCESVELLSPANFLGTNLFGGHKRKCFLQEDIILLMTRLDFEILVPKMSTFELLSQENVSIFMRYFNQINKMNEAITDENSQLIVQQAFYDVLGGFLHNYLVPMAKLSFYADNLKIETVDRIINMYEECRNSLNTNGNGWRNPKITMLQQMKNIDLKPLVVESCKSSVSVTSCALLDLHSTSKEALKDHMIVALPKLEPPGHDGFLSNICLPFKTRRIFNLLRPKCACIFLKFYRVVTHCYQFQCMPQDNYNKQLENWILVNLGKHFDDKKFYPGLGGVLRLYETLRRNKGGIDDDEDSEIGCENQQHDYRDSPDEDVEYFPANRLISTEKRSRSVNWINQAVNINGTSNTNTTTHEYPNMENVCSPCDKEFENDDDEEEDTDTTTKAAPTHRPHEKTLNLDNYKRDFITFIKIFLSLMSLLLLCILCSCLCNRRPKPSKRINYSNQDPKVYDRTDPLEKSDDERIQTTKAPFCGLFRSRKKSREKMQTQYKGVQPGPMSFDESTRTQQTNTTDDDDDISLTSTSSLRFHSKKKLLPLPIPTSSKQTSENSSSAKNVTNLSTGRTSHYGNKVIGMKANFVRVDEKNMLKLKNQSVAKGLSSATRLNEQKKNKREAKLDAIETVPRQRSTWTRLKKALPKTVGSALPTRSLSTISYYHSSSEREKRCRQKGGEDVQNDQNTDSWETTFTSG